MSEPVTPSDLDTLRWELQDSFEARLNSVIEDLHEAYRRIAELHQVVAVLQKALTASLWIQAGSDRGFELAEKLVQQERGQ